MAFGADGTGHVQDGQSGTEYYYITLLPETNTSISIVLTALHIIRTQLPLKSN